MISVAETFNNNSQILYANTGTAQTLSTFLVLFAVFFLYRIGLILLTSLSKVLSSSLDLVPGSPTKLFVGSMPVL
jgi:hypothetical protein